LKTFAIVLSIGTIFPSIGQAALIGSKSLKSGGEAARSLGDLLKKDLNRIKKDISDQLEERDNKIIIVIDDIDRLNDREIRQIFQLVKSLADFPKTVYLLTFDRDVVVKAIENDQFEKGDEYLEKIVQIPIEIPIISKKEIEKKLYDHFMESFKDIPDNEFDQIYWGNIYNSGLKFFFKNIRDVTRYFNVLGFYFELVKEDVNVIDFCAITAIQIFIPNVYQGIRENKKVFAGTISSASQSDKEKYKEICDSIIKSSSEDTQIFLKDHLTRLFPKLSIVYGDIFQTADPYLLWRKNRRMCSEIFFDRYFKFSLSDEEISQNDIKLILASGNNYEKLFFKITELNASNKILSFLTIFPDHIEKIEKKNIELFVTVLLDLGDSFPKDESLISETDVRIHFLMKSLLAKLDSQEERFKVLKNSLETATRGIYTVVLEVTKFRSEFDDTKEEIPMEKLVLNSAQLDILENIAKVKIKIWDEKGRLDGYRDIRSILYQWKKGGADKEDIDNVISRILESDSKLINFVSDFLSRSFSSLVTDLVSKTHYSMELSNVEEFVNLYTIECRLKEISSSGTLEDRSEREKRAVKLFLDNIENAKNQTPSKIDM
jgi:predicted KAP-like P-loop ATPase